MDGDISSTCRSPVAVAVSSFFLKPKEEGKPTTIQVGPGNKLPRYWLPFKSKVIPFGSLSNRPIAPTLPPNSPKAMASLVSDTSTSKVHWFSELQPPPSIIDGGRTTSNESNSIFFFPFLLVADIAVVSPLSSSSLTPSFSTVVDAIFLPLSPCSVWLLVGVLLLFFFFFFWIVSFLFGFFLPFCSLPPLPLILLFLFLFSVEMPFFFFLGTAVSLSSTE
mmetsp:Transcript_29143/g.60944  ORF Transcript_29143/g.60944 Transcript_29143/m.60944 type:complete len:220 (+) Transcript_29143:434-1093(+)